MGGSVGREGDERTQTRVGRATPRRSGRGRYPLGSVMAIAAGVGYPPRRNSGSCPRITSEETSRCPLPRSWCRSGSARSAPSGGPQARPGPDRGNGRGCRPPAGRGGGYLFFRLQGSCGSWRDCRTDRDRCAGPIPPRGPRRAGRRAGAGRALGVPAGLDGRFVPGQSRDDAARLARLDGGRRARPRGVPRPRAGWPPGRRRPHPARRPPRSCLMLYRKAWPSGSRTGPITDARGRAVLTAFFPEEISTVFVSAPGLGRQYFGFESYPGSRKPRTIELSPVGRVEGRIVADDPEIARSRKLTGRDLGQRRGSPAMGLEYLTTDPQGRFVIPAGTGRRPERLRESAARFALVPLVGERPEGRGRPDDPGRGQGRSRGSGSRGWSASGARRLRSRARASPSTARTATMTGPSAPTARAASSSSPWRGAVPISWSLPPKVSRP